MKQTCLAIIPARGGSKGIPKKNIQNLGGKPLIAWTIETALACPILDRVIVSTDDGEIADVARQFGADVPFVRPSDLAMDDTPDFPVFAHALAWLKQHDLYEADIAAWLRPTTPLRSVGDIISATETLINKEASCVRSVTPVEHHPYWMKTVDQGLLQPFIAGHDEHRYYRRQMLPPAYRLNGAIDVVRCSCALESGQLFGGVMAGYVMPPERSIDIDTEFDFSLAEIVLTRGLQ